MTPAMMLPKIKQNDPAKREERVTALRLRTNLPGPVATLAGANTEVKATNPKKIATTAK
jgi:hypothetical protein